MDKVKAARKIIKQSHTYAYNAQTTTLHEKEPKQILLNNRYNKL